MKRYEIFPTSINRRALDEVAGAIADGKVAIIPTDSLYALACDALNSRAIETLCRLRSIDPRRELLSIVCADISMASDYARIDNRAFRYMREYLPGPITFILPAATSLPKAFKGRHTVGVRIPDNPIATELSRAIGHPLNVASATAAELPGDPGSIALAYGNSDIAAMIDGGELTGIPSTVVDLTDSTDPQIIRQGNLIFRP